LVLGHATERRETRAQRLEESRQRWCFDRRVAREVVARAEARDAALGGEVAVARLDERQRRDGVEQRALLVGRKEARAIEKALRKSARRTSEGFLLRRRLAVRERREKLPLLLRCAHRRQARPRPSLLGSGQSCSTTRAPGARRFMTPGGTGSSRPRPPAGSPAAGCSRLSPRGSCPSRSSGGTAGSRSPG